MGKVTFNAKCKLKYIVGLGFFLMSINAYAYKNFFEISALEKKQLPPFCTHGFAKYNIDQKTRVWLNHLCPGLNALNYAQQTFGNRRERHNALKAAEDHLSYTLSRAPRFPFRATVFIKRGTTYELLGDMQKAFADYHEAVRLKPKNIYGYRALANAYLITKNKAEATKYIEKGLAIKPKSRMLLSLKKKIVKLR